MSNILITGATGFIGGFIVDEALRRDMDVWVLLRKSSSRKWLTDGRIRFIEADMSSEDDLAEKMRGLRFDYVVHAAGVTKSLHREDFRRVNVGCTKNLVNALLRLEMPLRKFVYLSSLSIFGPVREEQPYKEILETDRPQPSTEYGKSKLEAEQWLEGMLQTDRNTPGGNGEAAGLPVVFLRPTGVYGPRERDYFMMAKSINAHADFAVGYKPQDITFCGEYVGRITGKVTALNNDKYHIMKQRNWRCDIGPARRELGFEPKFQLEEGVRLTIRWYKENGWL